MREKKTVEQWFNCNSPKDLQHTQWTHHNLSMNKWSTMVTSPHRGGASHTTLSFFWSVVTISLHQTLPDQLVCEISPKYLARNNSQGWNQFQHYEENIDYSDVKEAGTMTMSCVKYTLIDWRDRKGKEVVDRLLTEGTNFGKEGHEAEEKSIQQQETRSHPEMVGMWPLHLLPDLCN